MENYNTQAIRQSSPRGATYMYLRFNDKKELMSECGDAALILMEYYLSKGGAFGFEFTDEKSADVLGWSERKVGDSRRRLIKAYYFLQKSGRYSDGTVFKTTFLGKKRVKKYLKIGEEDD